MQTILIPCYTINGDDFDCEYPHPEVSCDECILTGGNIDPRTGKKFIGKHKGHLKKYKRDAMRRSLKQEPQELTFEMFKRN